MKLDTLIKLIGLCVILFLVGQTAPIKLVRNISTSVSIVIGFYFVYQIVVWAKPLIEKLRRR